MESAMPAAAREAPAPEPSVRVERRARVRGACLRLAGEATPEVIGLLRGRLLARFPLPPQGPQGAAPPQGSQPPGGGEPPFGLLWEGEGYAACWPLAPGEAPPEGLEEAAAPEGWYAVAVHAGACDRLGETLARLLAEWLPHSGFRWREGPLVHRFPTDPRACAEADLRTEVCLPVAPDPIE